MTEQNLHDYNKWLMEVWNPNQLYIPFAIDAPKAFLDYQAKQLTIPVVNCLSCRKNPAELCGSCVSDIAQATGEQAQQSR